MLQELELFLNSQPTSLHVSKALSKSEQNYSVIQKECLALVYALKQFRHYLLGCPFKILTDHAPLQWLSAQKMEGLLARWALAILEYEFTITYAEDMRMVMLMPYQGEPTWMYN